MHHFNQLKVSNSVALSTHAELYNQGYHPSPALSYHPRPKASTHSATAPPAPPPEPRGPPPLFSASVTLSLPDISWK